MVASFNSPGEAPPSLKKSNSSSQAAKTQSSIASFFQKKNAPELTLPTNRFVKGSAAKHLPLPADYTSSLTPAPSSDAPEYADETPVVKRNGKPTADGLPSPITPSEAIIKYEQINGNEASKGFNSPSRKVKKVVSYAESDAEDQDEDGDIVDPSVAKGRCSRIAKRRKTESDEDDIFDGNAAAQSDVIDEDDFVVEDESDADAAPSKKRKRAAPKKTSSQDTQLPIIEAPVGDDEENLEIPTASTAQQWTFEPDCVQPLQPRSVNMVSKKPKSPVASKLRGQAHTTEPDKRYPWLANIQDIDRNSPGHPDYDPRTVYIPPGAWAKFSPFEKQYWEIKQKFWDTIVFFKKGKFYELYENDATLGHQLFDLKLTDRVNMRMVGVPEMSLDGWANQFVAKGFKIARVDQRESALGKEMRERDDKKASKEEKIIKRELACVLTSGTLVNGGMLQEDLATYCVSIKESEEDDGRPSFGISFVDAATGQFFLTDFVDDVEMTKFETFIAQTRPQELLLEKGGISTKALRILKSNTGPTTIWNHLKPKKEFWTAEISCREIDASKYYVSEDGDNSEAWPRALKDAREKDELMSSFGALVQYLRTLQIDRELLTLRNIDSYDPIKKASSLVLDGKTLINLEVFANSVDGRSDGTLFALLNRCITPFGKRMFKQWVCHPLMDPEKINARLDAVDSLNADRIVRDDFTSQLTKLPDLERMISRIHAGSCKAQDFVKVLDGFEQIDYTMGLLRDRGAGDGILGQLISNMPDLRGLLISWKESFDHAKARENGLLIPERGVEKDFDESQDNIEAILADLEKLLKKTRKDLGSSAVCYRDSGKEVYQLEVPIKIKSVPKNWDQMSATVKVKRYYFPELRTLVRQLQEAQETHGQIVKEVSSRFFVRFSEDYTTWLAAVRIVAHLDCLISLAKASSSLGEPACRPIFISQDKTDRSTIDFTDLRHPCLPNIETFIPNDISLGGSQPNISLLTGANAAGKSTILRQTCIAVIMAQMGCYIPCLSARLTPVDRIMSRLGANDNIFAAQSTFFVELAETKKILSEATPSSLVILDELGRGTSSYDGVAVAQACLHHIATHVGCIGFFATHYHSLAAEFEKHPEIENKRMRIHVDDEARRVTFLYKLESGVAEGSFGMHCASMCGIPARIVERAEIAAKEWEHTSRLKDSLEVAKRGCFVPLGMQSDVAWILRGEGVVGTKEADWARGLDVLRRAVEGL